MAMQGKITQHDVDAICERLMKAGQLPSTRLIRSMHGAGSTGTIQQMLRAWQTENPEAKPGVQLSAALQKALEHNMEIEVTQAKQNLQAKLDAAGETITDLIRENEQLTEENAQLQEANGKLMDGLAESKGQVQQLEADLNAVRAAADKLRVDMAMAQLRVDQAEQLQGAHAELQKLLAQERDQRLAVEKLASVTVAQRDAQAERVAEERSRTEQLASQVDRLAKELTQAAEWKGHVEELRAQLREAKARPSGDEAPR